MTTHHSAVRTWAALTLLYGVGLLAAPGELGAAISHDQTPPPTWVTRLLGARQVGQGAALLIFARREAIWGAVAVDTLHAGTMALAAGLLPSYRRPALFSGTVAILSAAAGTALARAEGSDGLRALQRNLGAHAD